jgi:2-oxoisovalerate dehydrogenase E1 component alpha subunit
LIEALTYRLSDHTTADDASRYRSEMEVKDAWAIEPLIRTREFLVKAGAWNETAETAFQQDCSREVDEAVSEYLNTPKQSTDSMFDHLFAAPPAHLQEQRSTARKYGSRSSGH